MGAPKTTKTTTQKVAAPKEEEIYLKPRIQISPNNLAMAFANAPRQSRTGKAAMVGAVQIDMDLVKFDGDGTKTIIQGALTGCRFPIMRSPKTGTLPERDWVGSGSIQSSVVEGQYVQVPDPNDPTKMISTPATRTYINFQPGGEFSAYVLGLWKKHAVATIARGATGPGDAATTQVSNALNGVGTA